MLFNVLMLFGGLWLVATGSPIFGGIILLLSIFNIIVEIFE